MPDSSTGPPPPPPSKRDPKLRSFGGYEIEGELGRGGMGVVYLARQIELNRRVALKMLTGHYGPDELQRFLAEAETAAGLHHTNIAHIYEVGEHEGAPYFSMEYVEAGSLADRLRKELPSPSETAQLLISVARALHFAHQNGVVHRDMKPGNVLLDPEGIPKVADFGIAKRLKEETHLTISGAVIGTPTYMAPEQAKGTSRHVGAAADVYSLGAILYEMLTGRPPFLPEDSETAITVRVLTEDPVSPAWHRPEIPRDLEVICMKCLEKAPRDRYESAAAFAEDLRRFLDDETIIARPPTTAVRTLKWVRRHPWKFVTRALLLLLVAAGLARLVQWQLYERQHIEYAARVDWVNGALGATAKLKKNEISRNVAHVRLTRRGRLGQIAQVEVLNPRGHPAVLRRVFNDEVIPIHIEGITGAQPYAERAPETTKVEFSYDGRVPLEATGRDRNGAVNWRLLYDRQASTAAGTARGRFVNLRGFDATSRGGASHMEFERDSKGFDIKIRFFNAAGQPAANGEKVYGYKFGRDDAGRITSLTNLDRTGAPTPNGAGLTSAALVWSAAGNLSRIEVRDAAGQPGLFNGVAIIKHEHDAAGNTTRTTMLGANGQPAQSPEVDWAMQEIDRNEHGEITSRKYFKVAADGKLTLLRQLTVAYDQFGYPADVRSIGPSSWRSALRHDAKGNPTEEQLLDADGRPIAGDKGYAIKRLAYNPSPQGLKIEQTYFDAAGQKTYHTSGYHRLIDEFDITGVLRRQIMDEHDPARFKYHRYVTEPEYDAQGRTRRSAARYEDAQGRLATNAELPHTATEELFDEEGRPATEWKLNCDVEVLGAPAFRTETEWHRTGARKRIVRQACDADRKPLPFITKGTGARFEEEFDEIDQRVRIYESGFDEKTAGFSTREAKFEGGRLQTVTHKRSDGSVVDRVGVFITAVFDTPDQPKAAQLRRGDQFLSANGNPVQTAYHWVATNFSGGAIEVLRDGKRILIDGFNAGTLGVALEDRVPQD